MLLNLVNGTAERVYYLVDGTTERAYYFMERNRAHVA